MALSNSTSLVRGNTGKILVALKCTRIQLLETLAANSIVQAANDNKRMGRSKKFFKLLAEADYKFHGLFYGIYISTINALLKKNNSASIFKMTDFSNYVTCLKRF